MINLFVPSMLVELLSFGAAYHALLQPYKLLKMITKKLWLQLCIELLGFVSTTTAFSSSHKINIAIVDENRTRRPSSVYILNI